VRDFIQQKMKRAPMGARFYWFEFQKSMKRVPMDARFYWFKFQTQTN